LNFLVVIAHYSDPRLYPLSSLRTGKGNARRAVARATEADGLGLIHTRRIMTKDYQPRSSGNNVMMRWAGPSSHTSKVPQIYKCSSDTTTAALPNYPVPTASTNSGRSDAFGISGRQRVSSLVPHSDVFEIGNGRHSDKSRAQANVTDPLKAAPHPIRCLAWKNAVRIQQLAARLIRHRYMGGFGNSNSLYKGPTGRHLDGSNFLFCDGHVKLVKGRKDLHRLCQRRRQCLGTRFFSPLGWIIWGILLQPLQSVLIGNENNWGTTIPFHDRCRLHRTG